MALRQRAVWGQQPEKKLNFYFLIFGVLGFMAIRWILYWCTASRNYILWWRHWLLRNFFLHAVSNFGQLPLLCDVSVMLLNMFFLVLFSLELPLFHFAVTSPQNGRRLRWPAIHLNSNPATIIMISSRLLTAITLGNVVRKTSEDISSEIHVFLMLCTILPHFVKGSVTIGISSAPVSR